MHSFIGQEDKIGLKEPISANSPMRIPKDVYQSFEKRGWLKFKKFVKKFDRFFKEGARSQAAKSKSVGESESAAKKQQASNEHAAGRQQPNSRQAAGRQ